MFGSIESLDQANACSDELFFQQLIAEIKSMIAKKLEVKNKLCGLISPKNLGFSELKMKKRKRSRRCRTPQRAVITKILDFVF